MPARNASALIALLSAHLPIPDLKFLKRVRGARPGEYPDLFGGASASGAQEKIAGVADHAEPAAVSESGVGKQAAKDGSQVGGEKTLLAMIGPHEEVAKLEKDGEEAHRKIMTLCCRLFDGRIPAFPPNTKQQFDEWSKVKSYHARACNAARSYR